MIPLRRTLTLAVFAALATAARSQVTVYTNAGTTTNGFTATGLTLGNRTDNGETWIGTPNTGSNYYGLGAGTATLTLAGLQPHNSVTIAFDLYMTGSQDGNGQAGGGEDPWQLLENGTNLLKTNFANYGGDTQAYPSQTAPYGSGGSVAPRTGSDATLAGKLGFGTGDFGDSTYHLSYTFAETSTTQTFSFVSGLNEGANNEGWGLDNVRVSIVPVATPEPASFAAVGVGALALLRRRKA